MTHDLDSFRDLAWQALEKPADAVLRAQVEAALSDHPEWADEWKSMRETHALARESVPAAFARREVDRSEEIPAERLEALLGKIAAPLPNVRPARPTAPRTRTAAWNWLSVAAAVALIASVAWLWRDARARTHLDISPWLVHTSPELAHALTAPLASLVASANLPTLRADEGIHLRSPILATAAGEVVVSWNGPSNVTVTLRERGRPLWTETSAQSPVTTPLLPAGETYEIVLTDGTTTIREHFVTVFADSAQPGLAGVLAAVVSEPARLGDGARLWKNLPEKERHSEIGVRLGLWLGVQARQPDILDEAKRVASTFEQ